MSEDVKDGRLVLKDEIEVVDEEGESVLKLPFRDAIEIDDGPPVNPAVNLRRKFP